LCDPDELRRFTATSRFGYLRHLLRRTDLPIGELLAAHVIQSRAAHADPVRWTQAAVREMIVLLKDDYPMLTSVLGALDQAITPEPQDELDT
jgi:hypothetical protein